MSTRLPQLSGERTGNGNGNGSIGRALHVTELRKAHQSATRRAEELAIADLHRTESLAILAHEFRNAIAPLANGLLILRMEQDADSPARAKAQSIIERQVSNLSQLVNDLQEISSIDSRHIRFQPGRVDLREVVQKSVDAVTSAYASCQHQVSVTVPPEPVWLDADSMRMEQVAVNLLSNAAKYTLPGGRIDVLLDRVMDRAELRVADSGIGIEPEMLPLVFDLFVRVESGRDHRKGMGIGLNVVKRIVTQHGGSVAARSAGLGTGSEFVVSLPLEPSTP
ncbi:MAG TPA: HAMP domain-containing sensor histidine kinase [Gemmatimonadaceae bacterium]